MQNAESPVAIVSFAIHQKNGQFTIRASEVGSERMSRARSVLTPEEMFEADAHIRAAAAILGNYAIRTLTPDYADALAPISGTL